MSDDKISTRMAYMAITREIQRRFDGATDVYVLGELGALIDFFNGLDGRIND